MEISKMFHHYNALLEADDKGFTQSSSATLTEILIAMSKMKPRTQEDALALMCIGATCADVSASAMESPLTAAMNTAHRRCHFAALEFSEVLIFSVMLSPNDTWILATKNQP